MVGTMWEPMMGCGLVMVVVAIGSMVVMVKGGWR